MPMKKGTRTTVAKIKSRGAVKKIYHQEPFLAFIVSPQDPV
jgi:hypothetical protein